VTGRGVRFLAKAERERETFSFRQHIYTGSGIHPVFCPMCNKGFAMGEGDDSPPSNAEV